MGSTNPRIASTKPEDPVLATLRGNLKAFSPRQRQGVVDRKALTAPDMRSVARHVRNAVESGDGSAVLQQIGLQIGVRPRIAAELALTTPECRAAVQLDVDRGCLQLDLDRVLDPAAAPLGNDSSEVATREWLIPLPAYVAAVLRAQRALRPWAATLGALAGSTGIGINTRLPLEPDPGIRLRKTWSRARHGLAPVGLDQGIHALVLALLIVHFGVATSSNFAYTIIDAEMLDAAAAKLYAALDWGPPEAIGARLPAGSLTTPTRAAVEGFFGHLAERVTSHAPGRNASISTLIRHHNSCAEFCSAWTSFFALAREAAEFDLPAILAVGDRWFWPPEEKGVGPTKRPRTALITSPVRRQIALWRSHCRALLARFNRSGRHVPDAYRQRLEHIEAGRDVDMFFHLGPDAEEVRALGSGDVSGALPPARRLAPDAGRHYFLTALLRLGIPDRTMDVIARHAEAGTESMSSTSMSALRDALPVLDRVQTDEIKRLGLAPLTGLSSQ